MRLSVPHSRGCFRQPTVTEGPHARAAPDGGRGLLADGEERGYGRLGRLNRNEWIDAVLVELSPSVRRRERKRLPDALLPFFGADAVVWTTDVAGLSREQAVQQLSWTARALVKAVLSGATGD